MKRAIDINADLGEGGDFDRDLLGLVSSANISCGAHAGSVQDIDAAIVLAVENGVCIGAHPSYPDRSNYGRRSVAMTPGQLRQSLMAQMQWLASRVDTAGGRLQHVKPHGALYNDAARDHKLARVIAQCVRDFDPSLTLTGLAGGHLLAAGTDAGLRVNAEAFVDRRYLSDGNLVPRTQAGALITNTDEALAQVLCVINGTPLTTADGGPLCIQADTLCIHGDSSTALVFARKLVQELSTLQISVRSVSVKHPA